jgi:AraC-like DNA-binding protein
MRCVRVDFHTITLITGGSGVRTVDFKTYPCRPGTLLWVRPGQVHGLDRTDDPLGLSGTHVRFPADFPPKVGVGARLVNDWTGPVCRQLGTGADYANLFGLLARLEAECCRPTDSGSREIRQHLLAAILLHIDRLPAGEGHDAQQRGNALYTGFRAELERSYATTRRVEDYADRLGYSVKTLTRACLAAIGQSAKHVIDGRVTLEAERLLAHTDDPVASIARDLGFGQPTNFGKFFARNTGMTPGEFRTSHQN